MGVAMTERSQFGRREFFVRAGVVGAAVVLFDAVDVADVTAPAGAGVPAPLTSLLDQLATDTINGLIAFVVPGPDAYSVAQGVSDAVPGGIAADGTAFLLNALDNFYPVPEEPLRLLVQALATGLSDHVPALPGGLNLGAPLDLTTALDQALAGLLGLNGAVPLSEMVALLLNFLASIVDPASIKGTFLSPFSNLSFAGKAGVFALLEEKTVAVAQMIDGDLPEPLHDSLSGLLAFLAGALLEFAAFGSYSEFGAFNATTGQLTGVPVGWRTSNYLVETNFVPVEGWDEFQGYFGNVRQVSE
jgi:hypothetical protein